MTRQVFQKFCYADLLVCQQWGTEVGHGHLHGHGDGHGHVHVHGNGNGYGLNDVKQRFGSECFKTPSTP